MTARESATAQQRRVWDKAAASYDRQMRLFDRVWFPGGREWLGARARGRVLEVAIGTGLMIPEYGDDVVLSGVDLSPAMLALARRRAAELGRAVDLCVGDAERLPYGDACFDTVVCALALCNVPDPDRALAQMHRVLVPGGRLLLLDHVRSSWPPLHAAQWLVDQVSSRVAGEHMTRRHRSAVEAAGFVIEEAERLKAGTVERIRAARD